jgi:hypothetical protein
MGGNGPQKIAKISQSWINEFKSSQQQFQVIRKIEYRHVEQKANYSLNSLESPLFQDLKHHKISIGR